MAKSVLLSIRPKWVDKIAKERKTVEIRKSHPSLDVPFKCYIYCTKNSGRLIKGDISTTVDYIAQNGGKVVGEFLCDKIETLIQVGYTGIPGSLGYKIRSPQWEMKDPERLFEAACLNEKEVNDYLNGHIGYGWHISKILIYDKPRELDEFYQPFRNCQDKYCEEEGCDCCSHGRIRRPPQSWCYVEEL